MLEVRRSPSADPKSLVSVGLYRSGGGLILASGATLDNNQTTFAVVRASKDRQAVIVRWWDGAMWHQDTLVKFVQPQYLDFGYHDEETALRVLWNRDTF